MNNNFKTNFNYFMYIFMYELELQLNNLHNEISTLQLHLDEANTDAELKRFIKNFIEKNFNTLPQEKMNHTLTISTDNVAKNFQYSDFDNFYICKVLLANEIDSSVKKQISKNSSVYTNPDLLFIITDGITEGFMRVELKSTKKSSIPGSSIQQVDPLEWVIFVKNNTNKNEVHIQTGQYLNCINSKLQFPDRSPRPQVSFNELHNWNKQNRLLSTQNISYRKITPEVELKNLLLLDWQNFLAQKWIDVLFNNNYKSKEPWFNTNLRKFILMFLKKYDTLTLDEKNAFKTSIESVLNHEEDS